MMGVRTLNPAADSYTIYTWSFMLLNVREPTSTGDLQPPSLTPLSISVLVHKYKIHHSAAFGYSASYLNTEHLVFLNILTLFNRQINQDKVYLKSLMVCIHQSNQVGLTLRLAITDPPLNRDSEGN